MLGILEWSSNDSGMPRRHFLNVKRGDPNCVITLRTHSLELLGLVRRTHPVVRTNCLTDQQQHTIVRDSLGFLISCHLQISPMDQRGNTWDSQYLLIAFPTPRIVLAIALATLAIRARAIENMFPASRRSAKSTAALMITPLPPTTARAQ